mmetsp:Transcript_817/g.2690  ORF Transcript_817/g.2690 Transcript_817/m.2690 type:complete len:286 (-) Transcript_817:658-1515(-)
MRQWGVPGSRPYQCCRSRWPWPRPTCSARHHCLSRRRRRRPPPQRCSVQHHCLFRRRSRKPPPRRPLLKAPRSSSTTATAPCGVWMTAGCGWRPCRPHPGRSPTAARRSLSMAVTVPCSTLRSAAPALTASWRSASSAGPAWLPPRLRRAPDARTCPGGHSLRPAATRAQRNHGRRQGGQAATVPSGTVPPGMPAAWQAVRAVLDTAVVPRPAVRLAAWQAAAAAVTSRRGLQSNSGAHQPTCPPVLLGRLLSGPAHSSAAASVQPRPPHWPHRIHLSDGLELAP